MKKSILNILAISSLISFTAVAHEHHKVPKLTAGEKVISGQEIVSGGYRYIENFFQLPDEVDMWHAHGLARDKEDNIYLAYQPKKVEKGIHVIVMFNKHGEFIRYIGDHNLGWGAPHGLDLVYENGQKFLYLSTNFNDVKKLDMQGNLVWQSESQETPGDYGEKYRPTDSALDPNSNLLYIADGYGSNKINLHNKNSGHYLNITWTGAQAGNPYLTPHGVTYDPRHNQVIVSDRGNKRILYYTTEGKFVKQVKGQGISAVCNTDVWQDYLLVPNLDGTVVYLDKNNKLIDTIELNKVLGEQGHKHPHDAIFMSNGDVVIGTWKPGKLSYWQKID
ncbi:hypothetical protein [Catenovulum sediminis]|uniref:6-bladed beta-propeller n=1 Tax=Catenovulum sediminis TaxID=1740262 RepID=A0ABV1RF81_9ALTE